VSRTDELAAQLHGEIEERKAFIDGVVDEATTKGRDLEDKELELITRAKDRIEFLAGQLEPLRESIRLSRDSAAKHAEFSQLTRRPEPAAPEYRSAGEWVIDQWKSGLGDEEARQRMQYFARAAAHQLTTDNTGIIPEPIVGSVLNFIDAARPIVSALGTNAVPSKSFTRPKVTQHTDVGPQATEKTELVSRKMLITETQVIMATYGGYVNVSRQNIDWSTPSIMDLVINDLAAQYAIDTETATYNALNTAATDGPDVPLAPDAGDVAAALWGAAGLAFGAMKGAGRLFLAVGPDMLGVFGGLFAPVNPQNAQSTGFSAGNIASGQVGSISGIPVVLSTAVANDVALLVNTAAAEVYEQRIGSLQVTEPSVLGVQVAYAGYFAPVVLEPGGVVKITQLAT
jgi:hypothetical protein